MARAVTVTSSLGPDAVMLYRLQGTERLGEMYEYRLALYSKNRQINLEEMLAKTLSVEVEFPKGITRYFHGYVTQFSQIGKTEAGYAWYEATLHPFLWFLTRTQDCRIFQQKTAPDIITEVLKEHGFTDFKKSLTGKHEEREYCVQYGETDFHFINRLMQEEGIYYFFKHEQSKHTMVMADSSSAHSKVAGESSIPYRPPGERVADQQVVWRWDVAQHVQSGKVVLDDYDFEKPRAKLEAKSLVERSHPHADLEVFDYPGRYVETKVGKDLAKILIEQMQADYTQIIAESDATGLAVGGLFSMKEYPRKDQNDEHLIIEAEHTLQISIEVGSSEIEGPQYTCLLRAIKSSVPFRSRHTAVKPRMFGPQTAVVVGKKGEDIWTDKYGRIKVQFHWDRLGKSDENSSCWVRVAHAWAGKGWGIMHIPRIGQEVVVEFLDGDPDRPLVTGVVYNADHMPPNVLPDNQTQSGIKSRSTKKGDAKTFNELRFEDKKDSEEIYFHAERDFSRVVENNDTLKVGLDKKDPGDQTVDIHNNRTVTLIEGNDKLEIKKGDLTIKITSGKGTIEAATSLELKVGSSSVKIEPAKITLKATEIAIQGDAKIEVKSPTTTVKGDGTLTLQGGMVKIN